MIIDGIKIGPGKLFLGDEKIAGVEGGRLVLDKRRKEMERRMKKTGYITLYHFCTAHDIRSILQSGLTKGCTPIWENGRLRAERRTQWLTADSDPSRQSWNTQHALGYSRTAYRLTVRIPYGYRKKLIPAAQFIARYPEENAGLVRDWPGSDSWYVFCGVIPPAWIEGHRKINS